MPGASEGRPRLLEGLRRSAYPGRVVESVEILRTQRRQAGGDCVRACRIEETRVAAFNCRSQMTKHVSGASVKIVRRLVLLAGRGRMLGGVMFPGAVRIDEGALLAVAPFSRGGFPGISWGEHRQKKQGNQRG